MMPEFKPFRTEAHIHSLDGKLAEATILDKLVTISISQKLAV